MLKNYICDICDKPVNNVYYGNWLSYCENCKTEGKQKNWELDYDNTIKPSIEYGNFSDIDGELAEDMLNFL